MNIKKVAFLTGITGQDSSYLAELLLEKGYEVHGLIRRSSSMCNRKWIDGLTEKYPKRNNTLKAIVENESMFNLHYGDLTDFSSLQRIINTIMPDELYHLGAQTHVGVSFDNPITTMQINCIGTLNLLEVLRTDPKNIRMYNASTSEMLAMPEIHENGTLGSSNEQTQFSVHSPYAVSKLAAHELCKIYRESYGLFVCNGILFNHESERRGDNFVTQKIIKRIICMVYRLHGSKHLNLGNINSYRDWGHAKEYVEAMWLMLQQDKPDDYVIATNESHSVKEFIDECCNYLGVKIEWTKSNDKQEARIYDFKNLPAGFININEINKRPWDVDYLRGDYSKAERVLGWKPRVRFKELIRIMIDAEVAKHE